MTQRERDSSASTPAVRRARIADATPPAPLAARAEHLSGELHAFRHDAMSRQEILRQRAEALAHAESLNELAAHDGQHIVCFRAGETLYGVELRQLREIRPIEHFATVPNTPRFLLGLIQVHGDITPVIDLVEFFGSRRAEALPSPTVVLVIEADGQSLGLACDDLLDVRPLSIGDVVAVPAAVNLTEREVARGLTRDRTLILDGEILLHHPRLAVGQVAAGAT